MKYDKSCVDSKAYKKKTNIRNVTLHFLHRKLLMVCLINKIVDILFFAPFYIIDYLNIYNISNFINISIAPLGT